MYGIYRCASGQGTFGQVVRCRKLSTGGLFAIKLIKNIPAYLQQSLAEITILKEIEDVHQGRQRSMLRMHKHFFFRNHLCLVRRRSSLHRLTRVRCTSC